MMRVEVYYWDNTKEIREVEFLWEILIEGDSIIHYVVLEEGYDESDIS